ncbi:hypothetical protein VNO80_10188 [Phaseolus coccineus]|uniref:Uncharacterized protein n=1 Tax=Phaseolus coccineus TaxID=3886 RepID=A0AAN9RA87_PHACN
MFNAFMFLVVYRKHKDICGVIIYPCNYFAAVIFKIGKISMIYLAFYALNYVFLLNHMVLDAEKKKRLADLLGRRIAGGSCLAGPSSPAVVVPGPTS